MSIYNAAVTEGIGALQVMFTGRNAQTDAAYNAAYAVEAKRRSTASQRDALQGSLALVHQEKILSNQNIRLSQARAEAAIKVQAAVSGVSGQSIGDLVYNTKKNAAFANNSTLKERERMIDNLAAEIGNTTNSLYSIQDVAEPSTWGALLGVASQISYEDVESWIDYGTEQGIQKEQAKRDAEIQEGSRQDQTWTWGTFS